MAKTETLAERAERPSREATSDPNLMRELQQVTSASDLQPALPQDPDEPIVPGPFEDWEETKGEVVR